MHLVTTRRNLIQSFRDAAIPIVKEGTLRDSYLDSLISSDMPYPSGTPGTTAQQARLSRSLRHKKNHHHHHHRQSSSSPPQTASSVNDEPAPDSWDGSGGVERRAEAAGRDAPKARPLHQMRPCLVPTKCEARQPEWRRTCPLPPAPSSPSLCLYRLSRGSSCPLRRAKSMTSSRVRQSPPPPSPRSHCDAVHHPTVQ